MPPQQLAIVFFASAAAQAKDNENAPPSLSVKAQAPLLVMPPDEGGTVQFAHVPFELDFLPEAHCVWLSVVENDAPTGRPCGPTACTSFVTCPVPINEKGSALAAAVAARNAAAAIASVFTGFFPF